MAVELRTVRPTVAAFPAGYERKVFRQLLGVAAGLLAAGLLLWLTAGYHGAFQPLNGLGAKLPDGVWAALTVLGDARVALALLLLFVFHRPELLAATLVATLPTTLIVQGIKRLLMEPRPSAVLDPELFNQIGAVVRNGSFPSGHSATIAVMAGLLFMVCRSSWQRILVVLGMLLVALSRVMVGAHWPVDILVGCGIGLMFGAIGYAVAVRNRYCHGIRCQWLVMLLPLYAALSNFQHDGGYPQVHGFVMVISATALLRYLLQVGAAVRSRD